MNELKFNSQICTTKIQSQRLLDLGLKPETADMCYIYKPKHLADTTPEEDWVLEVTTPVGTDVPAWSLHRLMEIAIKGNKTFGLVITKKNNIDYCYERLICDIERLINAKAFNKEYLKQ